MGSPTPDTFLVIEPKDDTFEVRFEPAPTKQEFGDSPGHAFHGNQWQTSAGGGEGAYEQSESLKAALPQASAHMAAAGIPNAVKDKTAYTPEQRTAVLAYVEKATVNDWLRSGKTGPESPRSSRYSTDNVKIANLDAAVSRYATTAPITVFRGSRADPSSFKAGDRVSDKGYTSTSVLQQATRPFSGFDGRGTTAVIDVPVGTSALYVGGKQAEVLFPRDATFEVTHVDGSQVHMRVVTDDPVTAAGNADHSSSAMIAWFPSDEEKAKLRLDGGEDLDHLHCTILYLGKTADIDEGKTAAIAEAVANRFSPFTARIQGTAIFNTEDGDVLVRLVDAPELEQLQQRLHDEIVPLENIPDNHGFTAHITIKYLDPDEEVDPAWFKQPPLEVGINSITTDFGAERTEYPLATTVTTGLAEFGDTVGHEFHGNQWTGGHGKDGTAGETKRGLVGQAKLRAAMADGLQIVRGDPSKKSKADPQDVLTEATEYMRQQAKAEVVRAAGKDIGDAALSISDVHAEFVEWAVRPSGGDTARMQDGIRAWGFQNAPALSRNEQEAAGVPPFMTAGYLTYVRELDNYPGDKYIYGEQQAQRYVDSWAQSSSDDYVSQALQMVTEKELGAESASFQTWIADRGDHAAEIFDREGDTMAAFVRGQYDRTQEFLQANNIDEVTLHRGVSGLDLPEGETSISMNPASSWSVDEETAYNFAERGGDVLTMTVPAEDIIGTARTGLGALSEGEVVVRNQPGAVAEVERA